MNKKYKRPELSAPAGDWASLRSAIESGADAVYFGVKGFNMRGRARNFCVNELPKITGLLHKAEKRAYLALNTIVFNSELKKARVILQKAKDSSVDGVILWDMGLLQEAKAVGIPVHLSTQSSVSNFSALKFYSEQGVKRIVLARECGLKDIKDIIRTIDKEKIDCDIEVFVHGAMCVSISGRCFLSQISFSESANRGLCLQPCRREYLITDIEEPEHQYKVGKDYILSPKDLCVIEYIDELIKAGISAFKIEGRNRSPEYVGVVVSTYREAIDAFFECKYDDKLKKALKDRLKIVYNRGFSNGFFFSAPEDIGAKDSASRYKKSFLGEVRKYFKRIGVAEVLVRNNSLREGQLLLIYGQKSPARMFKVSEIEVSHKKVQSVSKGVSAGIKVPFEVNSKDKVFLLQEHCEKIKTS